MQTIGNLFSISSTQIPSASMSKHYQNDETENDKLKKNYKSLNDNCPLFSSGFVFNLKYELIWSDKRGGNNKLPLCLLWQSNRSILLSFQLNKESCPAFLFRWPAQSPTNSAKWMISLLFHAISHGNGFLQAISTVFIQEALGLYLCIIFWSQELY